MLIAETAPNSDAKARSAITLADCVSFVAGLRGSTPHPVMPTVTILRSLTAAHNGFIAAPWEIYPMTVASSITNACTERSLRFFFRVQADCANYRSDTRTFDLTLPQPGGLLKCKCAHVWRSLP